MQRSLAVGRTLLIAIFAGFMWIAAMPAHAASRSVQEIATYRGADRQAVLEAGARREGVMLVYGTNTQASPLYAAFAKKYPFIKVEAFRADAPTVSRRMMEEYRAGTYLADALDLNTGALHQMMEAGLLQPYDSPELAAYRRDAVEQGHHWVVDYESYLSLGYNTHLVPAAAAPKTLDDLLDPKWRGKMAVAGTSTLPNWIGSMLRDKGEAFIRRLAAQQIRVYEISARAVANLVISGEVPLSPTIFSSHVAASRATGAPIAWRALGGVYATRGGMALPAEPPHPYAAMLYIDFVLSQAGQSLYHRLGYASARTDIENPQRPTKVYYLSDELNYIEEFAKWEKLAGEITTKMQ